MDARNVTFFLEEAEAEVADEDEDEDADAVEAAAADADEEEDEDVAAVNLICALRKYRSRHPAEGHFR